MMTSATAPGKLHIGFALPSLAGGGAERVTLLLAKSLLADGHRVDLILARLRGDYRAEIPPGLRLYYARLWRPDAALLRHCQRQGLELNPITVNPAGAAAAWLSLRRRHPGLRIGRKPAIIAWVIAQYLRRARPRLLVAAPDYANLPALYAAQLDGGKMPVIVAEHNNIAMGYTGNWRREAQALYPRAAAVVAVSQGVAGEAAQLLNVDPRRIHTIHNPIPSGRIWQMAQDEVTHPWFQDGQPPVILSIGRPSPQKDHATLVAAFGLARRRLPARLALMGRFSASYQSQLMAQARECGAAADLEFLDFDENPFRYMRRAGLFAISSRWEGLCLTLIEAMACGAPVASTDAPYGPAEILESGKWGRLTPVGDAPALAQAMVATLQGDRPPAAALRQRAAWFSERRAAAAYRQLFAQVANPV